MNSLLKEAKVLYYYPFVMEMPRVGWISLKGVDNAVSVSISWRHHGISVKSFLQVTLFLISH